MSTVVKPRDVGTVCARYEKLKKPRKPMIKMIKVSSAMRDFMVVTFALFCLCLYRNWSHPFASVRHIQAQPCSYTPA
jgi:hypothetical protein